MEREFEKDLFAMDFGFLQYILKIELAFQSIPLRPMCNSVNQER
jgi:hypothetical protein